MSPLVSSGDIQASSTTNGSATSVAVLADGSHVVVWTSDGTNTRSAIFGQRFDSSGRAVGSEFQVNNIVDPAGGHQPVATALAGGGFVVAWVGLDGPTGGPSSGILLQRYDAQGNPQGTETLANTTTSNTDNAPNLAALADGGYLVTWESNGGQDGSGWGIYAQRYSASGVMVGGEFLVNAWGSGNQITPAAAGLADGGWVVAWSDPNAPQPGIYLRRYDQAGVAVGGNVAVDVGVSVGQTPMVASLTDGGWVVTWAAPDGSNTGIFGQV